MLESFLIHRSLRKSAGTSLNDCPLFPNRFDVKRLATGGIHLWLTKSNLNMTDTGIGTF